MRSLSVSMLVKEYMQTNPLIQIPLIPYEEISFLQRVWQICSFHQRDKIWSMIEPPPALKDLLVTEQAKKVTEYQAKYDDKLHSGTGRDTLQARILEFKDPKEIPTIISNEYKKDPIEAGNRAQRLLGFNPDTSVPFQWNFPSEEETRSVIIPHTNIHIRYRPDLEDFQGGLYEFKLTTSKNLQRKITEALVQLFLYDFVHRLKFEIRNWQGMHIDIALIDKQKILWYNLFSKAQKLPTIPGEPAKYLFHDMNLSECRDYYVDVVKKTLKQLFKSACPDEIEQITKVLDDIYQNIEPALEEDEMNVIKRHKFK